ncbi:MFS transporter [Streptomyces albiaxialis]|uniref:MFS transporter n=1 Tax=Streptomyces albiaxialis TaxID=329523 RepID=A0ABN2VHT9_9ACTN
MRHTIPNERAGPREWLGLAVLMLPLLLVSMDLTVLHLAVPAISADLRPTSSELLWITDVYGFLVAGFLVTMGALGDRIGRRRLLLTGAAAFGAASALAAFSTSPEMLIATRALLGVAGATLMPSTLSLIRNMFPDARQRTLAIGIWSAGFMVGSSIGPPIGGVLLEHFWWGSTLLINIPVMVLLVLVGPLLLPEFRDPSPRRMDPVSVVLSVVAVISLVYGVKRAAEHGGPDAGTWIAAALGLAVGYAFVRRQLRSGEGSGREPLIDVRLFARKAFSGSLAMVGLAVFMGAGVQFLVVQYLQLVLGLSPLEAALVMVPQALAGVVGAVLAPVLARRVPRLAIILAGVATGIASLLVLSRVEGEDALPTIIAAFSVMFLGFSAILTLATDTVVASAPPERSGAASALSETTGELSGALGIALLGSTSTAVYRSEVADGLPGGLPDTAADAARDTLGGAVAAAERLPETLGGPLLDAARGAFTGGLHLVAAISVGLVVVQGLLAVLLLRARPDSDTAVPPRDEDREGRDDTLTGTRS